MIHIFKKIIYNNILKDAGHNLHQVRGEGYLKVPKSLTESSSAIINTWYTPSTPVTVISPVEFCQIHHKTYRKYTTNSYLFTHTFSYQTISKVNYFMYLLEVRTLH